ncbi:MAG: hypothetical protein HY919_04130 [Elusimicrobia bacterium]|nr:hypothetical protein [Elusimicrobiota bacterium]
MPEAIFFFLMFMGIPMSACFIADKMVKKIKIDKFNGKIIREKFVAQWLPRGVLIAYLLALLIIFLPDSWLIKTNSLEPRSFQRVILTLILAVVALFFTFIEFIQNYIFVKEWERSRFSLFRLLAGTLGRLILLWTIVLAMSFIAFMPIFFLYGAVTLENARRILLFSHKNWILVFLPVYMIFGRNRRFLWQILSLNLLFVPIPRIPRWKGFGGGFSGGAGVGANF